jgi:hypothetical protein
MDFQKPDQVGTTDQFDLMSAGSDGAILTRTGSQRPGPTVQLDREEAIKLATLLLVAVKSH